MPTFKTMLVLTLATLVASCSTAEKAPNSGQANVEQAANQAATIATVLAAQPEATKARYSARKPQQTLQYFGVEPGMTVVEALPGGGWYSKILLPILGPNGQLIGVNYAADLWPLFPNMSDERLAALANWTTTWTQGAEKWRDANSAPVSAFVFGGLNESQKGTADVVLFIRALHNMARFKERPFLAEAFQNSYDVLKPGGIVGIVQHEARTNQSDEWADGSRGYLKREQVIATMRDVGFEFVGASEINQNPADQPGEKDIVWRLPPSLATSKQDDALRAQMEAVGESNRMTLKFRKPQA